MLAKKPPSIESTDLLFSFLPSKAGVGTSTIALNVSMAISSLPETKALLCDFDLNSGMIHFMLKLTHAYSVVDAARRVEELDEYIWQDLISTHKRLELLHSGEFNPDFRIETSQVRQLLDFARRHYKAICVDLSGNMEQYSLDIMRESKRIFLVCTPEINALHLARRKYRFLKTQDLGERVSLLLNRVETNSVISESEIEEMVGLAPVMTLPNNYVDVQRALTAGTHVDPALAFGRQCSELAHRLLEQNYKAPRVGSGLAAFISTHLFQRLIHLRSGG
jgi:pilus assembly protein CpaE